MNFTGSINRFLCMMLAIITATAPSVGALAQTNAAQQAVRQRVQGLGAAEEVPPAETAVESPAPIQHQEVPSDPTLVATPGGAKIDARFIAPSAIAVIVLRPAQLLSAPLAELMPIEVASAASKQYVGFDPADVDEIVAFVEMPGPAGIGYGVTIKFNKPFRGASIPPHMRPNVQLSELAGRKYLQSSHPLWPSYYGTDKQTLIAAPEATLRQLVESSEQPKSGPLLDRVREEPAGSDLYLAVDMTSLRPIIQQQITPMRAQAPPPVQPLFDAVDLIAAADLTLNIAKPGPTSLMVHANDENAAQQLETIVQNMAQTMQVAAQAQMPPGDDPISQAMLQYRQRVATRLAPERMGASIRCFYIDGQNAAQQQLLAVGLVGIGVSLLLPAVQAAREAARRQAAGAGTEPEEQPPADF